MKLLVNMKILILFPLIFGEEQVYGGGVEHLQSPHGAQNEAKVEHRNGQSGPGSLGSQTQN